MLDLFQKIQRTFPDLEMVIETNHLEVDLNMDIRKQESLVFDINLNLQGDELHLCVEHFWCEWFPCTDENKAHIFYDSVCGLLSGTYRIVEYY